MVTGEARQPNPTCRSQRMQRTDPIGQSDHDHEQAAPPPPPIRVARVLPDSIDFHIREGEAREAQTVAP